MKIRTWTITLLTTLVLSVLVLAQGSGLKVANARDLEAACATPIKKQWQVKGNCGTDPSKNYIGTSDAQPLVIRTNKVERMRVDLEGKVGIGTSTPGDMLTVRTATNNYGLIHTDGTVSVGTWAGTGNSGGPSGWFGTKSNHPLRLFSANGPTRLKINTDGGITIGTETECSYCQVRISGRSTNHSNIALQIINSAGNPVFQARDDGNIIVGKFGPATTSHVCVDSGLLSSCASAAEYVPSVDTGHGFPDTADLVSIAPEIKNPFGDAHGPFAVHKTAEPCDSTLLGFIVDPKFGADGPKLNDHYLPLAIYGYFPAKVTMENGWIQRGDPLTSSSKPGYAMKATGACKIIGYALQDARGDGKIQVFADLGENAAGQVTELQDEVSALQAANAELGARLATLERAVGAGQQVAAR